MDPDHSLVRAAAAGDREAFDLLVRRHQTRLFNLIRALTADDDDAADLAQETFVRAYRGIGRFRGSSSFKTWLYRIAANVVRSDRSRRGARAGVWQQANLATPNETAGVAMTAGDDPETALVRRELTDRALAMLPADLRLAVTLRDVEGLEYREIAEVTGVPIGTVESRIFRARQRLREALAPLFTGAGRAPRLEQRSPVSAGSEDGPPGEAGDDDGKAHV